MEYRVFDTKELLADEIANEMLELKKRKKPTVFCLAAGHTSLPVFARMTEMQKSGMVDFREDYFVGLDELQGFGKGSEGGFFEFMRRELFEPIGLPDSRIIFYDGRADLEEERMRVDEEIERIGGIDFLLLGVGLSGHLGLNEPGTPFDQKSIITRISDISRRDMQKYFKKYTPLEWGVSLGMQAFVHVSRVILMVTGPQKKDIVTRILSEPVNEALPATFVKQIENSSLFADNEAAGGIIPTLEK